MSRSRPAEHDVPAEEVVPALLRAMPLPALAFESSKYERGQVLIIGGSRETPGGVLLAGLAAFRAGAGRVQLATAASVAAPLAIAVPEARVVPLPETPSGAIAPDGADRLTALVHAADAVVLGTGALESAAMVELVTALVRHVGPDTAVVLDAGALDALAETPGLLHAVAKGSVLTPNPRELERLVPDDGTPLPDRIADAAARFAAVIAHRNAETVVAAPRHRARYRDRSGHPGLGISGSGDVLVGILAGLLARGTDPLTATLWAVHVHGVSGERLAARGPGIGLLARELVDEIPYTLRSLMG